MTCSSGVTKYIAQLSPFLCAIALITSAAMPSAGAQQSCPVAGNERVAVASVDERLELALSDGRVLRAAVGDGLDIVTLGRPDRWGRIPVFAFLPPMSAAIPEQSLAVWLLARGDGRFMPEREANICRAALLDAENASRAAGHGLWNDPYYAVIAATDQSAFAEKA